MNIKELKFLLTHSSIYGIGTVVSQIVAFIMLPIYTRYLTPEDYGVVELLSMARIYSEGHNIILQGDNMLHHTFIDLSNVVLPTSLARSPWSSACLIEQHYSIFNIT